MNRMDLSPNVGEDDLHAVVDGQLAAERHSEVMAYLAAYPDAADRVSAFFRQRVELAALRESLDDTDSGAQLATLEEQLCRVVRNQHRVRRALGTGGLLVALLAAASGWWLTTISHGASGSPQAAAEVRGPQVAFSPELVAETSPVATAPGDSAVVWLQAKLAGRTLKQPNLEALGLHFVGSNALKSARGPAVRLLYTDGNGQSFDLFAGVRESGIEAVPALVPEGRVALTWQKDPLVFALVAPQGSSRLADIMRSAGSLIDPAPIAADAATASAGGVAGGKAGEAVPSASPTDAPATTSRDSALPAAATGVVSKPL